MATKLTHITGQYHSYVNDQLLTHLQLNETIDFFEDQNRMHNVYLHGTGIACGFETSFTETGGSIDSITIKQGNGITTDGDVIKLKTDYTNAELTTELIETKQKLCAVNFDNITYKSFKKFDVDKGNYARFIDSSDPNSLITIWELFPEKTTALESGESELSNFVDLKDYVILLYLENYTKPKALCSATDCSNLGGEEVFNLRVLVVDKTNADIIKADDTIFNKYDNFVSYEGLPELNVKKVPLTSDNSASQAKLKEAFFNVVNDATFKTELTTGISTILNTYNYTSQLATITTSFTTLFSIDPASINNDVFYRYDALKDITATYMELKDLFIQLCCECNPDIEAFPKHLFLGLVEDNNQYKSYRHKFYKASYLDNNNETYNRFDSLVQRLVSLFNFNKVEELAEMKITPSPFYGKLGAKSIPFYYIVDETLLKYWDFDKTVLYNQKANFSYHTDNLKTDDYIQNTLVYCLTDKNFFRIEGYTKSASTDIETFLKSKKDTYGLDFDYLILDVNSDRDQLDYLIEQNRSFEHLCGVKKGGTLLILKEGDAIITDFCIENRTVLLEEIIEEPCGCSIADCFSFMKPSFVGSKATAKSNTIKVKPRTNYNCLFIRWVTLMLLWLTVAMLLCCKKCSCSNNDKGYNKATISSVIKKEPLL